MVAPRGLAQTVRGFARGFSGRFPQHRLDDGASLGRRRKRGAPAQAIGRSRGGRTTKIHAVCDALGRAIAIKVTPGQLGDVVPAAELLGQLPPSRRCAADTAYDSNALRQFLCHRGTLPVIPNNPTRKRFHTFDRRAYKRRNLIERAFCRLKDWRRVATRYDKLARNFHAAVAIAAVIIWWA